MPGHVQIRMHQVRRSVEAATSSLKTHFHELQANKTANQSQISKLTSFYKNSNSEQLASKNHLNNAIYFASVFNRTIPDNLLKAAQKHIELLDEDVLRAMSQKLLRMNQWAVAERLINLKLGSSATEMMKFEVFALNGNYRKMLEQLPHLGKSLAIPQNVNFQLICVMNSKDGNLPNMEEDVDWNNWSKLLQIALKGRILSLNPPTFTTFLRISDLLSRIIQLDPSLLVLGFTKTTEANLNAEAIQLLKSIFLSMKPESLMILAEKLQSLNKNFPEELISILLEQLCKYPIGTNERTTSSLLGWIIKFCPDQYSYTLLMKDYNKLIDERIFKQALNSIGLLENDTMNFIEYYMMTNNNISIEREMLKKAVDIATERFDYSPSEDFMRFLHQKGYVLSSIFYLNHLELEKLEGKGRTLIRAFESYKLISADTLHGDLLQKYLKISKHLLEMSIKASNLDFCNRIYNASSKYQILNSLNRPKSFRDFVSECYSSGKFQVPFKVTINLDCIRAVIDCTQQEQHNFSESLINEKFCVVSLQAAMTNLDFETAQKLRVYMNNRGYNDGGTAFSQNILQQWTKRLKELNDKRNEIKY